MKSIDDYIINTKNMENTSDGGSPAYHFDDGVVLVKYIIPTKYGIARENEELIALAANKKNEIGIRTPKHIKIKRIEEGKNNICWVLQERAPGVCFDCYSPSKNNIDQQLKLQMQLLNAPDEHYEKCVKDICSLYHMGLELKSKNIYYDKSTENGGFTFIDLLSYNETPLNPEALNEVLFLNKLLGFIYNIPAIFSYNSEATEVQIGASSKLRYQMMQKVFNAMETVLPNFSKHRRWVLRSYSSDVLDFFKNNGTKIGDLALNDDEYKQFDDIINHIVDTSIEKIESGKYLLWQIEANEIRNDLESFGMYDAWLYHNNNELLIEDFDNKYDYEYECKNSLQDIVKQKFYKKLSQLSEVSDNIYVIEAKKEYDKTKIASEHKHV